MAPAHPLTNFVLDALSYVMPRTSDLIRNSSTPIGRQYELSYWKSNYAKTTSQPRERFIPNPKLKLLDQVSELMRFKHWIRFTP